MTDISADDNRPDQSTILNETTSSPLAMSETARIRAELIPLAQSAVESRENELAATALIAIDLLSIVNSFEQDSGIDPVANEMLQFCAQQALPTIKAAATNIAGDDERQSHELALLSLREEVRERWGSYLELLSPDDLCQFEPQSAADEMNTSEIWDNWNQSATGEVVERPGVDDVAEQNSVDFNLQLILSSLNELSGETAGENITSDFRSSQDSSASRQTSRLQQAETASSLPTPPATIERITDPEMVSAYADDAQQCLAEMEASLLNLESGHAADEARRQFCRQLHTLKGASGTVGLLQLASYLHELESYVESVSGSGTELDIQMLLQCVDVVRDQISAISPGSDSAIASASSLSSAGPVSSSPQQTADQAGGSLAAAAAKTSIPAAGVAGDGEQFVRVEASRLDRLMDLLAELVMLRNRRDTYVKSLRALHHELNDFSTRTRTLNAAFESGNSELAARDAEFSSHADESVCHDPPSSTAHARLLSRSLLELSNDVSEIGRSLHEICEPLSEDNSVVSHLIGRFRQELMELQRMPIGGLFQRLHRSVRDAARAEDKQVELIVLGQGARVERSVQERLFEPLMHIVRNAVSHGIESAEVRAAAGKPTVGRLTLNAWSSVSSLFIEISDDGRGLNDELLESKGRKLGLLPAGQPVSRERLWKLIFHPGFSTRAQVTEISGRGVGMDIVDNWVRRLRGRIDVESVAGQGTTFRLQIPIRSAIEHAMIVQVGGQLFALPMQAVSGTADASPRRGTATGSSGNENSLSAPATTSILHLNQLLGIESTRASSPCYLSLNDLAAQKRQSAAAAFQRGITIAVDAVVGVEEVVVRALPPLLQRHELFSGVTLSGRADTVLLLDVPRLIEYSRQSDRTRSMPAGTVHADGRTRSPVAAQNRILITDDSVTVRRTLSKKLRARGFAAVEASNGAEALKVLRSGGISAVVTDIDMPRMNGLELLQEIRSHRQFGSLPVVIVTSRDERQMMSRLKDCGATDVLCKPVTDATVSAIINVVPVNEPVLNS